MKTVVRLGSLAATLLLMCACKTSSNESAASLTGTEWTLTQLNQQPVIVAQGRRMPTLTLDASTQRVSGMSGVNRFSGNYQLDGPRLKFGNLAGTRMAGPPESMALESAFLSAMQKASSWKTTSDTLELSDGGTILLQFTKL